MLHSAEGVTSAPEAAKLSQFTAGTQKNELHLSLTIQKQLHLKQAVIASKKMGKVFNCLSQNIWIFLKEKHSKTNKNRGTFLLDLLHIYLPQHTTQGCS